jgi:hypothetical protein
MDQEHAASPAADCGEEAVSPSRRRTARGAARPARPPVAAARHASGPQTGTTTVESVRDQMLSAVAQQVAMIETRLAEAGAEVEERDSRILGNLAKTLATLQEIGEGGTHAKDNPMDREPTDRGDAEARLARKIEAWARGEA